MTTPSADSHERWDELAVGYALSALEPEETTRFEEHLASCSRCAAVLKDSRHVMAELAFAEPQAELPRTLRAAILRNTKTPKRPGASWRWVRWGAVAACVATLAALAAWNAVLRNDNSALSQRADRAGAVVACLRSSNCRAVPLAPLSGGSAPVVAVVRPSQVELVVDGLTPNNVRTSVYVLWQKANGDLRAVRNFDVGASGVSVIGPAPLVAPLAETSAFAVSLEPGRVAPVQPSHPVAIGSVSS